VIPKIGLIIQLSSGGTQIGELQEERVSSRLTEYSVRRFLTSI
jgi:hypothetical protein